MLYRKTNLKHNKKEALWSPNLLRHQIFSQDMGWGKQRKYLEQKFHSRFYSSPFYMKCFIYYFHQHPPSSDASLLPRNRLTQFHQKRKPSSSNSVSLPFPDQPASTSFTPSPSLIQRSQASTVPLSRSCPWYSHGWAFHRTACDLFPVLFQLDLSVASDAVDLSILHEVPPRD